MAKRAGWRVLVATDGSREARAALTATVAFPWPRRARAWAVVARGGLPAGRSPAPVAMFFDRAWQRTVLEARRVLGRRWPRAGVRVVDRPPPDAILAEARRVGASVIVVAPSGRGRLGRLLLGSVSRDVVRRAPGSVLVVKGRPRRISRFVLGFDGSAHSRRAVELVGRLAASPGGRVTVLRVVEPVRVPSMGLLPAAVRRTLAGQAAAAAEEQERRARREVEAAAHRLVRAGWRARAVVAEGVPLAETLKSVRATRADVLVLGARGVGGVRRLLLGSVADGALNRSPVSVLIVR